MRNIKWELPKQKNISKRSGKVKHMINFDTGLLIRDHRSIYAPIVPRELRSGFEKANYETDPDQAGLSVLTVFSAHLAHSLPSFLLDIIDL